MPAGMLEAVGIVNSVIAPHRVMRPILPVAFSVNQTLPSGPVAMAVGSAAAVGSAYSVNEPGCCV
jgi:hypothetical protein